MPAERNHGKETHHRLALLPGRFQVVSGKWYLIFMIAYAGAREIEVEVIPTVLGQKDCQDISGFPYFSIKLADQ